jgi:hypothetical protein
VGRRERRQGVVLAANEGISNYAGICSLNKFFPVERTGTCMTSSAVLITDMAILVGVFLLGFLAKIFPRGGGNAGSKH